MEPIDPDKNDTRLNCPCRRCSMQKNANNYPRERNKNYTNLPILNIEKFLKLKGTKYERIVSEEYLMGKYGARKSHYILVFINCIHHKLETGVAMIPDDHTDSLSPWVKSKLFLLLVTLSQRGGPEYWSDKLGANPTESKLVENDNKNAKKRKRRPYYTLTEHIMRRNIKQDFSELNYDDNYVFSSIWANFMEGLINHYLERVIIPHSETKVCQQLYKPMMKIISLYNEYNELMEKSEKNGFLQEPEDELKENIGNDIVAHERLYRAQQLLWQARQDIPKTISKELTLLSEMYSTLSADEQDYELDEFVCCAEEYIELEYLPALIEILFSNATSMYFWKIMMVLEPFFYYIEDSEDSSIIDECEENIEPDMIASVKAEDYKSDSVSTINTNTQRQDPRVITLEKICEVAARQKWI
ncbi:hypothetical protein TBLA_0C00750 [Henningerozyma blattae CBS 6284]|uniref:Uncharacterized protein n=1 Tax=Henningerozyma blattae (strain ATCC 34711 / CBS 6284 / DSM 70876 / NBRC 10599 / NRRL Y-10934 / UCD 77-7) TaxID=1071380 RepID=I2H0I9_HENB6|nr:hypothetical protein TBLA_0C00750 [Tetrapisispora blattae CBS 6284]CCH59891.1 hypothetical protein TBLA_0C00750 [Tetrapisispora blattae CBS 6284]